MKHTLFAKALVALLTFTAIPAVNASVIMHETISGFDSITAIQGLGTNSSSDDVLFAPVPVAQSNLGAMFDNNLATAYSLGLGGTGAGGTLELVISPSTNLITRSSVVQGPFGATAHDEIALVSLGLNGGGYVAVGRFKSTTAGPEVINLAPLVAKLSFEVVDSRNYFSLIVLSGVFNTLRLNDESPYLLGANGTTNRDGFDISVLSITSSDRLSDPQPVPEPGTLALAFAALLAAKLARRR